MYSVLSTLIAVSVTPESTQHCSYFCLSMFRQEPRAQKASWLFYQNPLLTSERPTAQTAPNTDSSFTITS